MSLLTIQFNWPNHCFDCKLRPVAAAQSHRSHYHCLAHVCWTVVMACCREEGSFTVIQSWELCKERIDTTGSLRMSTAHTDFLGFRLILLWCKLNTCFLVSINQSKLCFSILSLFSLCISLFHSHSLALSAVGRYGRALTIKESITFWGIYTGRSHGWVDISSSSVVNINTPHSHPWLKLTQQTGRPKSL